MSESQFNRFMDAVGFSLASITLAIMFTWCGLIIWGPK